jgi:hypothetical protein
MSMVATPYFRRGAIEACLKENELLPFAYRIARDVAECDPKAVELARTSLAEAKDMGGTRWISARNAAAAELRDAHRKRKTLCAESSQLDASRSRQPN